MDILVEMDYEKYGAYVTTKRGQPVLYVVMARALYGEAWHCDTLHSLPM